MQIRIIYIISNRIISKVFFISRNRFMSIINYLIDLNSTNVKNYFKYSISSRIRSMILVINL